MDSERLSLLLQALLNPDFEAALEVGRPAPRFRSFLIPVMREHVALMQAMGYRYITQEQRLLPLDRFLQRRPDLSRMNSRGRRTGTSSAILILQGESLHALRKVCEGDLWITVRSLRSAHWPASAKMGGLAENFDIIVEVDDSGRLDINAM